MLTASHCVPWAQGSGKWSMQFIPAYNGEDNTNSRPFGTAWATQCRGVRNTDDVTGLDYVICQLDTSMGDTVGYMGWRASSGDSLYYNGRWTSVGYPDDFHGGQVAAEEDGIKLEDVDDQGSDGKELESYVYASAGWSGGPLFDVEPDWPRVVGVMSGSETEFSFWDFFTATHSVSAGGLHMGQLITYGRTFWTP
jgi:V8-like Glu-specific endopeptidase